MALRVAVWGPGNLGRPAIRAVVAHPELELCGVLVRRAEQVGRDAGALAGIAPVGVAASDDVAGLLAARPDALVYAVSSDFRLRESLEECVRALEAGVNVVSGGLYGLLHPPTAEPRLRARFEAACRKGGSSFLVTGADPGFANDLLPLVLSGMAEEIRELRVTENFDYANYHAPEAVMQLVGLGLPMDKTPPMLRPGVPKAIWGGTLGILAEALDVELDELREVVERHPLERSVELPIGRFEAGTLGAFRFELQGIVAGRPVLVVEHVTRIHPETAPQWPKPVGNGSHHVRIRGRTSLELTLVCDDAEGNHAAAGTNAGAVRMVNAIPTLCAAAPGLLSANDLPLLCGRGRVVVGSVA